MNITSDLTPERDWKIAFLEELSKTGNVSASARMAGISRVTAYANRESNEEFAALWDDAIEIATDALELEARRRALEGTIKPVFYQGVSCGQIQEYSDTLMIFLLKAHRPDKFREQSSVEVTGKGGAPFTVKVIGGGASMDDL